MKNSILKVENNIILRSVVKMTIIWDDLLGKMITFRVSKTVLLQHLRFFWDIPLLFVSSCRHATVMAFRKVIDSIERIDLMFHVYLKGIGLKNQKIQSI